MHLERPLKTHLVTQPYGPTDNTAEPLGWYEPASEKVGFTRLYTGHVHTGVDYAANLGDNVYAPADGTVIRAGWDTTGYGNCLEIDHGAVVTLYGHLSKFLTAVGDEVKLGQVVAKVGSTGNSTGPHLHWSVISKRSGLYLPPAQFIFGT